MSCRKCSSGVLTKHGLCPTYYGSLMISFPICQLSDSSMTLGKGTFRGICKALLKSDDFDFDLCFID